MADTLALEKLYTDVCALFAVEGTNCTNVFGWRGPAQHAIGPRIAWVPGDPAGGAGQDGPPRSPGGNPRPLRTLHELFQVVISSTDVSEPENELKQYKATRLLRDAWYRAAYLSARNTVQIRSEAWVIDKNERRFGTALRIVCTIESMIPDEALPIAPVDTDAVIPVASLNTTDTLTISPADAP